jgi:hypothetical protein
MYKPINGWTKGEIIRAIGMRKNVKSLGLADTCRYRGQGGAKCAVGVFIPDDEYSDWAEGSGAYALLETFSGLRTYMPLPDHALWRLQRTHDCISCDANINEALIAWVEKNVSDAGDE